MGITDDTKASSAKSNPVTPSVIISDTNGCHESAIPQMVITSVEGESEELKLENDVPSSPVDVETPSEEIKSSVEDRSHQPATISVEENAVPQSEVNELPQDPAPKQADEHKHSPPTAIQRPLIFDGSEAPTAEVSDGQNTGTAEQNKFIQTTVQRPLIIESITSGTAKKHGENVALPPESIYEVIQPSSSIHEDGTAAEYERNIHENDTEHSKSSKESEGFFARSKAFWKQDAKPLFSFPKFSFSTKEQKESPTKSKKDEKVKSQEYSLEAAKALHESSSVQPEQYKKLDDDAVVPQAIPSSSEPQREEQLTKKEHKKGDRSRMIHPGMSEPCESKEKHKALEDNFDLHAEQDPTAKSPRGRKRPNTPESLYDTCCIKFAVLLRNKAFEMAAEGTKTSPPKKPPKPTAEALAKARSEIATKRLEDYQNRPHNFGDDILVGVDGIRYADEDTESSTDYKDVDNFGVILNPECYGIIRKLKSENDAENFRAPSTCSGLTSYYTADTATLKDENSSDNTLETVSLGSYDSVVCRTSVPDKKIVPDGVEQKEMPASAIDQKSAASQSALQQISPTSTKKVPPPVPPKPSVLLKSVNKTSPSISKMSQSKSSSEDITRCVNSLSLSPRPILRSTGNSEGIKKRPLTIAGIKTTEFEQFSKNKSFESSSKKPVLNTVVKNKNLKTMRNLPLEPFGPAKSLSFKPRNLDSPAKVPSKPQPPPRPPPPIKSTPKVEAAQPLPSSQEQVSTESIIPPPRKTLLRHHVSPPRPLPPATKPVVMSPMKPAIPPPRPPPPVFKIIDSSHKIPVEPLSLITNTQQENEITNDEVPGEAKLLTTSKVKPPVPGDVSDELNEITDLPSAESVSSPPPNIDLSPTCKDEVFHVQSNTDISDWYPESKDVSNADISAIADSEIKEEQSEPISAPARHLKHPRPPPRVRRKRSRTVEIVPVTSKVQESRRRSQSLSDIEVEKSPSPCNALSPEDPVKALYTTVNKDPLRGKSDFKGSESDIDRLSPSSEVMLSRPLPPPPPPPRTKPHSTSRRSKSDERPCVANKLCEDSTCYIVKSESMPNEINNSGSLRPPSRKKKSSKQQFFSLRKPDHTSDNSAKFCSLRDVHENNNPPVKPERRIKHHPPLQFDENANVADMSVISFSSTASDFHSLPTEGMSKTPTRPRVRSLGFETIPLERSEKASVLQRSKSEIKKGHSYWYDDNEKSGAKERSVDSNDDWERLDWPPNMDATQDSAIKPAKMRTPPRTKKPRKTSTFYVDVAEEEEEEQGISRASSCPPREDKETSPLHLECSEKSVQTSLETLSVGVASRGELSDDTDDLLGLAQTLQDELKTIIKRHKTGEALRSSDDSCSTSESSQPIHHKSNAKKKPATFVSKPRPPLESTTSSASEIWQISSSDESEDDCTAQEASNLSEISKTKKKRKIFYIAQEIMSSEEAFVDALRLLNVDFRTFIETVNNQRGAAIVPDEVINQILNHLPQLQHLNENLLMELKYRIEQWDSVNKIADVIVKMGPFLKLYSWYIQDFESTTSLLEEAKKKYPVFGQAVKEYETSPRCKRLTLNHYMLKPVQRIPQYRLLLQEYLHHLPDGSEDHEDTIEALRIVSEVANHANESMKHGDNFQKLMSIQSSIIGHKEIIKPGRMFIKEGELMKLSRKGMQPRWFVLMSDLLLYLTPVQQGLYRVNHELTLAGMKVAIPLQQDYQNEFSIISVTRSFTLNAKSPEERQEWIVALTKAIEENASKRSTFTAGRLQQKSEHAKEETLDQGFILGRTAPVWIPDARVTMCQLCTSEFTVTFRRHHCRACGKVVCSICSSNRISLQYLGNRIARVCDECYTKLGQVSSGCTESGETDSDNQQIAVKSHMRTDRHHKKPRRQLPSVLKEVCANDVGSTISGYIYKRSNSSWKKSWFVVKQKVLYEFRASEDVAALRSIPLLGFQINTFDEPFEGVDPSLLFEISHPGQAPILFHAETPGSADRWIKELKDATVLE